MCIYCGTDNYRKIYENHHGPIPRDDEDRSYHIHHIDGNHHNNDPRNLVALSVVDHFQIHYDQEDWAACHKLGPKIKLSQSEMSRLSRLAQKKLVESGQHHLLGGEIQRRSQNRLVELGLHHNQDGSGTKKQIENGVHASQILISCIHCKKTQCSSAFWKDHGDKCDVVYPKNPITIDGITYNSPRLAGIELGLSEYHAVLKSKGKKPRPTVTIGGVTYKSVPEASRSTGFTRTQINNIQKGLPPNGLPRKTRAKKCVDPNGEIFDSLTMAADHHGLTVQQVCGRIKLGTWGWRYLEQS